MTVGVKSRRQYDCHIARYFSPSKNNNIQEATLKALVSTGYETLMEAQLQRISNKVMYHNSCISLARSNSSSISFSVFFTQRTGFTFAVM